eukprot:1539519-Pleurochrysis_carterae.AAC.1
MPVARRRTLRPSMPESPSSRWFASLPASRRSDCSFSLAEGLVLLELVPPVFHAHQLQVGVAQGKGERVNAGALSISRRALRALLVELAFVLVLQLDACLGPLDLHGLLEALPSLFAQLLPLLPAHERGNAIRLAEDHARLRVIAARPCACVMIKPKNKHAICTRALQGHAAHARAQFVGYLLSGADAAGKKHSRVIASRSRHSCDGRRQQAFNNRRSSGYLADAGDVEKCSASLGGQLHLLAHTFDDELNAAVNHGRRRGCGLFVDGERGWPTRWQHVEVLSLQRLGAIGDVAVAIVALARAAASRSGACTPGHLAADQRVRHLAAVDGHIYAEEARKAQGEGRHLVAPNAGRRNCLSDGQVRGEREAVDVEVFLVRFGDVLELCDLVVQLLNLALELLLRFGHRLHVEELAV